MKRIIICFDGTWNRIDADTPTNVLMLATGIAPKTDDGIRQIVHYDEGVGTSGGWIRKRVDGMIGRGILKNLSEAYGFLMFNYAPEDEVYVFGFSRGAFTARSFVGLVRSVGIIQRDNVRQVKRAIKLYKRGKAYDSLDLLNFRAQYSMHISTCGKDEQHRCSGLFQYEPGSSLPFKFRYVGVWDTVETIGLLKVIWATLQSRVGAPYVDRDHRFHDHKLNGMIVAGRHAVALDERRQHFHSEPWGDVEGLNTRLGFIVSDPKRPIQERFFPGNHGSVGGGGDIRGLSDGAFNWIVEGARDVGLKLDVTATSAVFTILPDYRDSLRNITAKPKRFSLMNSLVSDRSHKPLALHDVHDVHESARRRWCHGGDDGVPYRPKNLLPLTSELDALTFPEPYDVKMERGKMDKMEDTREGGNYTYHTVVKGETLQKIATRTMGPSAHWEDLFEINKGILFDPDKIFVGQVIRVPRLPQDDANDKLSE